MGKRADWMLARHRWVQLVGLILEVLYLTIPLGAAEKYHCWGVQSYQKFDNRDQQEEQVPSSCALDKVVGIQAQGGDALTKTLRLLPSNYLQCGQWTNLLKRSIILLVNL